MRICLYTKLCPLTYDTSLKAIKYAIKDSKCEKAQILCIRVIAMSENTSEFVENPQTYYDEPRKSTRPWFEVIKEVGKKMGLSDEIYPQISLHIFQQYLLRLLYVVD